MSMMIDTDVLIDFLRGQVNEKKFIATLPVDVFISTITIAELHLSVRDSEERAILTTFLDTFQPIAIDAQLAAEAGLLKRDYGKSHGVCLSDALIAATALRHKLQLVTLNVKHYPMVRQLLLPFKKT